MTTGVMVRPRTTPARMPRTKSSRSPPTLPPIGSPRHQPPPSPQAQVPTTHPAHRRSVHGSPSRGGRPGQQDRSSPRYHRVNTACTALKHPAKRRNQVRTHLRRMPRPGRSADVPHRPPALTAATSRRWAPAPVSASASASASTANESRRSRCTSTAAERSTPDCPSRRPTGPALPSPAWSCR
jgi:hypothetical protein